MDIGHLDALALRPAHPSPVQGVERALAIAATGLAGDVHADPLSPRQLLLAGSPAYRDLGLPAHALRENLLLDLDTARLRSGTVLQVGQDVLLRLMFQCEACGRLDRQRAGLARAVGARRGMLARVIAGGTIRRGDVVLDLGPLLPPWSDDWRERVLRVLDAVPAGCVVEYRQLAQLAGIAATYCRAFPAVLRKLDPARAVRAVPMRVAPDRPRWDGRGLFDDLALGGTIQAA
ncbi:MOSC domain-containing protein [uncultured Massilia sp.]|uniref:MOSC domain-containing protein n=1 Tax=uncultured Massilia sp. TaxID=169973 RepID=UPI0025F53811|nr:MOSC domain-containing protein [uncultured Massilia sp.]